MNSSSAPQLILLVRNQLCQSLVVLVLNPVLPHERRGNLGRVGVDWSHDYLLFSTDVHIYLEHWLVRASRLLSWRASSWFPGTSSVWLEGVFLWVIVKLYIVVVQVSLIIFVFRVSIIMEVLPLVRVLTLLLSVARSLRALSVFQRRDLRLERSIFPFFEIIPGFEVLLLLVKGIRSV